jgi:hypothetical protein
MSCLGAGIIGCDVICVDAWIRLDTKLKRMWGQATDLKSPRCRLDGPWFRHNSLRHPIFSLSFCKRISLGVKILEKSADGSMTALGY